MGLQLIVQAESEASIARLLGRDAERTEVFQLEGELWGLCIPMKVVDEVGEETFRQRLSALNIFDLYQGKWHYSKHP
jgi:hypothetical protein